MRAAPARLFDRNGIERAIAASAANAAAVAAAAAARIMHYLQLLFPLRLKSEIYRLRCTVLFHDNPSVLGQCRKRISREIRTTVGLSETQLPTAFLPLCAE